MVGHCFICSQKIMTTSFSFKTHLFSPCLFRAETPMPYEKWLKNEFSQCADSKDRQMMRIQENHQRGECCFDESRKSHYWYSKKCIGTSKENFYFELNVCYRCGCEIVAFRLVGLKQQSIWLEKSSSFSKFQLYMRIWHFLF